MNRYLLLSLKCFGLLCLAVASFTSRADCWDYAGKSFAVEAKLLKAISQVESAMNPSVQGKNTDGSIDYGLMQINSRHLPRLQKLGIDVDTLMQDTCASVLVGASILAEMVKVYGYGWEAVGAYNAGTGKGRHQLRMKYAKKVWQAYRHISTV